MIMRPLILLPTLVFVLSVYLPALCAVEKPNVLLVVADDLGWSDLGCYGSEIATPNLDALARRGVMFTSFYASVSCSPTRSMLLTGTDNHIAGLGNMGELLTPEQKGKPGYEGHLNHRVITLAEVLREAGYHTYMAGKWHLGHEPDNDPHARGFERTFTLLNGGASHWSDMRGLMEVESPVHYTLNGEPLDELPEDFYSSRSYTDFLIDAIREQRTDGKPFLAYLALTSPHDPMHVPEPWLSKYRGCYDGGYELLKQKRAESATQSGLIDSDAALPPRHPLVRPWQELTAEERRQHSRGMEVYAGMVENFDYHVGRVFKFLKDIGEYENTIVVFISDNGANPWYSEDYPGNRDSEWFEQFDNSLESIGRPGSAYAYGPGWASASSGPLSRFKMTVSEGGIRTPMIVAGPGIEEGRKSAAFCYVTDIMPTLLAKLGIEKPSVFDGRELEPMRGHSFAGILEGRLESVYGDQEFVAGELGNGMWIRRGNFKAVAVAKPYGSGQWQLYDIASDPGETNNLAQTDEELLEELKAAWRHYAEDVGVVLSDGMDY